LLALAADNGPRTEGRFGTAEGDSMSPSVPP